MAGISDYVKVEMALSTEPFATTPTWTDITSQVREVSWSHKRSGGPGGAVSPGRVSVTVDNQDARWDPSSDDATSPYNGNVKRDRLIRVSASDDSFSTESVLGVWLLDDVTFAADKHDAVAVLQASDILRVVQEYEIKDLVRTDELAGTRLLILLNQIGIPNAGGQADFIQSVEAGTVMVAAATLSGNALAYCQELMRAEIGVLYARREDGRIMFGDRYDVADTTAFNTSQATIDEADFLNVPVRAALALKKVTEVVASGVTGDVKTYDSTAATDNPSTIRQQLGTLAKYDADVEIIAEAYQKQYENGDASHPQQISLFLAGPAEQHATNLTHVVDGDLDLFNRILVTFRPVGWGVDYSFAARVEGVSFKIGADHKFTATLDLGPYTNTWQTASSNFYEVGTTSVAADVGAL